MVIMATLAAMHTTNTAIMMPTTLIMIAIVTAATWNLLLPVQSLV
jgi:hypothetical protein